jgi:hypothetical protein
MSQRSLHSLLYGPVVFAQLVASSAVIAYCALQRHMIHTDCAFFWDSLHGLFARARLGGNKLPAGLRFHHGILQRCASDGLFLFMSPEHHIFYFLFCVVLLLNVGSSLLDWCVLAL